jgi:hypothetical protein
LFLSVSGKVALIGGDMGEIEEEIQWGRKMLGGEGDMRWKKGEGISGRGPHNNVCGMVTVPTITRKGATSYTILHNTTHLTSF